MYILKNGAISVGIVIGAIITLLVCNLSQDFLTASLVWVVVAGVSNLKWMDFKKRALSLAEFFIQKKKLNNGARTRKNSV